MDAFGNDEDVALSGDLFGCGRADAGAGEGALGWVLGGVATGAGDGESAGPGVDAGWDAAADCASVGWRRRVAGAAVQCVWNSSAAPDCGACGEAGVACRRGDRCGER